MEEKKSILHELYVFSEWKPEPEYIQKPDSILPENISAIWRWLNFLGPKKSLIDGVTAHIEKQQKWHIALGDEGKVIAVLTDNILEIRTKRSEYATIAARTTVSRDVYPQWRKIAWSPDCSFLVLAYGNGVVSFFDLTASNLFNIPIDCSRPGGMECTDNTHAVADIIFMPLRVKDTKWNWEVLVVTYGGKLRGYLVSQTDGFKLHHTFRFAGGVAAVAYCEAHATLYVAGVPRGHAKDPTSPLSAGITAWRILNDEPFYKLSVVSDELEAQLANERFNFYLPFGYSKNMAFIVQMELSPDGTKLVCLHCNGDVSVWRLPLLKLLYRWPLALQPQHDLRNPLVGDEKITKKDLGVFYPADINWWTNDEIILSRFSGAVSVCDIENMANILGKKPEFFQGSPRITYAHDGSFMVLECESNVLPAKKSRSDESMEVVKVETDTEDTMLELTKELVKSVLYMITDMETFQPKPRRITVVSRVYRLLGVKSTTPTELFSRKIESGSYTEALTLAETFDLDSDLVYQQQWRKNPVSTEAIQKYLSKVSKKIWAVHQCVDRLPETLPAAKELLQFGLELTHEKILNEINKDREDDPITDGDDITLEHLNAYTSELLRCRHVMLFYKERLKLYESILRCEKSSYIKDEYDRLRSNSVVHSAMEIAKEGRIEALTCLWPHIKTIPMQLTVLEKLPETINPLDYQHLLPTKQKFQWFDKKSPLKVPPCEPERDWCRKEIFRSIWSSNWSEDTTPESETGGEIPSATDDISSWYDHRAREIEERSGLVSHALTLVTLATVGGAVEGLDNIMFHLLTLDTLIYDINVEGITLTQLEEMSILETCSMLMKMSTASSFVNDLKSFVIPFLKRVENLSHRTNACLSGLTEYLESVSTDDLSSILLVLQSPSEFELDVRTHLELAERCLFAYSGTEQLDKACDLLDTILKETDGSISASELVRRVAELERLVSALGRLAWRGVLLPLRELRDLSADHKHVHNLLTRLARTLAIGDEKPTQQEWEKLLKDLLELQSSLFTCITKEKCYEIYASSLLTSGDAASIRLAGEVLTCSLEARPRNSQLVNYARSIEIVSNASKEYFNSASTLTDPALELAKCCLTLIKDGNQEIQLELDLIFALQILGTFGLTILPIQVRLCENKISLIEDCLKQDSNAYLASHKLLKLATLLRIAGDDEQTREGQVLTLVCQYAVAAGAAGGAAAAAAARRLHALRHAPGAALLATTARTCTAHADRNTRRDLYAAAATYAKPDAIEQILRARLALELEGLQQMGVTLKENNQLSERWPSTDDEFSDAITTPVIEKKDLIAPPAYTEKKVPLFNYLLDTFQNKFQISDSKTSSSTEATEATDRTVHCQEFYRTLYREHGVAPTYYAYDRFSIPDALGHAAVGHNVLKWFYIQNCLENGTTSELEAEVVQKCAEEILYKDTPLSVACLLRSTQDSTQTKRLIDGHNTDTAVSCALYATLIKCNSAELRDNVYLTKPVKMARTTLKHKNASEEQLEMIRQCIERLTGMGEVDSLRALGYTVNGLLFNADEDYRKEIIYRVARSLEASHVERAVALAQKYKVEALDVWLQHAAAALGATPTAAPRLPPPAGVDAAAAHLRIREALWPDLLGSQHNALINYFTLLKNVDEKTPVAGHTPVEHIKLLKKAKAASPELDYKLLIEQPSAEQLLSHLLNIMKPENVGMLSKFLRSLPPAFKLPVSVNTVYTKWLTMHFFSLPPNASTKKWMQQYRQCVSYFNKLAKDDLLQFITDICFSDEAIERVPAGTRNLMIMQAIDYCQQEQENDFKFNKNEQTWAQVSQELTRWARFLEIYHSTPVQNLIDNINLPRDQIWPEIEKSHGSAATLERCVARLLLAADVRLAALLSLLQCLRLELEPHHVCRHVADHLLHDQEYSHGSPATLERCCRCCSACAWSWSRTTCAGTWPTICCTTRSMYNCIPMIEKSHGSPATLERCCRCCSACAWSWSRTTCAGTWPTICCTTRSMYNCIPMIEKSHGSPATLERCCRCCSACAWSWSRTTCAGTWPTICCTTRSMYNCIPMIEKSHGSPATLERCCRCCSACAWSWSRTTCAGTWPTICCTTRSMYNCIPMIEKSHGSPATLERCCRCCSACAWSWSRTTCAGTWPTICCTTRSMYNCIPMIEKSHGSPATLERCCRCCSACAWSWSRTTCAGTWPTICCTTRSMYNCIPMIEKSHGSPATLERCCRCCSACAWSWSRTTCAGTWPTICCTTRSMYNCIPMIEKSHGSPATLERCCRCCSACAWSWSRTTCAGTWPTICCTTRSMYNCIPMIEKSHGSPATLERCCRCCSACAWSWSRTTCAGTWPTICCTTRSMYNCIPMIEKSHGSPATLERCCRCCSACAWSWSRTTCAELYTYDREESRLARHAGALLSLLQCLRLELEPHHVCRHVADHLLHDQETTQTLCARLSQYHKDGAKFPEELLEKVLQKATEFGLPPHKQISLLSLSQRARVHDSDDMMKIAEFSAELFRNEWGNSQHKEYANELTGEYLMSEEGRREAFTKFLELSDTWQQKKVLVDVLNCWPPTRNNDSRSLHSEYLKSLLSDTRDQKESLVLIKLLLRRPVLVNDEIDWLCRDLPQESVINAIWVMLLSKCNHAKDNITNLVHKNKDYLQAENEIDNDLIKELLDNKMFVRLVGTPLYSHIIMYIVLNMEPTEARPTRYDSEWAINELLKAHFIAEAGQIKLMTMQVPAALRGFTQSVMYYKNMLTKKQ
ncbi:NBAS subunit of NRZ tethering complex-like [Anticarsia gemmatalis]|uniref:NBAS subunit of NRZ tethering complex-like n=1 Tax=Anticarsia gemmatalis TaxID=129554 RepID=UPI003F75FF8D